jgi:hypothetical protein
MPEGGPVLLLLLQGMMWLLWLLLPCPPQPATFRLMTAAGTAGTAAAVVSWEQVLPGNAVTASARCLQV